MKFRIIVLRIRLEIVKKFNVMIKYKFFGFTIFVVISEVVIIIAEKVIRI